MKICQVTERLMGTIFTLGVVAESDESAHNFLEDGINEVRRLECILSEFISSSWTSKINKEAHGNWVVLDEETFQLIKRCMALSHLSNGDFDITVSPFKKLYRFERSNYKMASIDVLASAKEKVGYDKVLLDEGRRAVKFMTAGMSISFAAIGKGFAADKVIQMWKEKGLQSGYVNASGDIRGLGVKPNGENWTTGIADPSDIGKTVFQISLQNNAIATSGNSEQHFVWKGKKYSHNISPHTGLPLCGIKSVTVVSPSAELSDALATSVYVKGVSRGLYFIDQLPETHAIIIDQKDKAYLSKDLNYEKKDNDLSDHLHAC